MTLTKFSKEYVDGVFTLERQCFSSPWSKEDLSMQLQNPNARFLVALEENQVVGYLGIHIVCGEGYVTNIAVLPQYRRKGIAKALLQKVMLEQMDFISLEVRKSNRAAISLYESLGFENVGERKKFYSNPVEDGIIMTKYFK